MTEFHIAAVVGRVLLAALFILAAANKIVGPKPVLAHMAAQRVPGAALPLVVALELGCGLALLAGWHVRPAALALAGFCLATALVFHRNFADRAERASFAKDIAIGGGLLVLAGAA